MTWCSPTTFESAHSLAPNSLSKSQCITQGAVFKAINLIVAIYISRIIHTI